MNIHPTIHPTSHSHHSSSISLSPPFSILPKSIQFIFWIIHPFPLPYLFIISFPFLPFLSFHQIHFHSIHIMPFLSIILLLLLCACPVVECDDTDALRDAVGCLCSVNSGGAFGSCCSSNSNGASLTLSDTQCFVSGLTLDSTNQYVKQLFVTHHFLQSSSSPFSFHSIRIEEKGLSVIPSGCFSSLSSLTSLFILLFHIPFLFSIVIPSFHITGRQFHFIPLSRII